METSNLVCIPLVKELLNEENYMEWKEWIQNYLLGQDLWDVVENLADHSNPVSRRKNAAAIHAIQMSCGPKALSIVMGIPSAKLAWDALTNKYNSSPPSPSNSSVNIVEAYDKKYKPLYKAVRHGDLEEVIKFLEAHPEGVNAIISENKETALQLAVIFEHLDIVKELVNTMQEKDLEWRNQFGFTALATATRTGIIEMARCMIEKNENLLTIPTDENNLPVTQAVICNKKGMALYLYSVTQLEELLPENGKYGAKLLFECIFQRPST